MSDSHSYWSAIYYNSSNRDKANDIIRRLAEDGVFLVRDGTQGNKVLVVYADNKPRKFRIENVQGQYCLESNHEVVCSTVEELLHYYYTTCLPHYNVYLTTPFQLHPRFSSDMMW
ncbi:uncharacterized protein LOC124138463 [Haliotis rufescens]|uniref:uncharacterized protein LOC124138463 n=1 Tax=Haliotis rufescens TaxID=6454 RepID=UPI001EB06272|nr:uncharacterized protein LOC124138463 [Haliotis rufescens]